VTVETVVEMGCRKPVTKRKKERPGTGESREGNLSTRENMERAYLPNGEKSKTKRKSNQGSRKTCRKNASTLCLVVKRGIVTSKEERALGRAKKKVKIPR